MENQNSQEMDNFDHDAAQNADNLDRENGCKQ